MSYQRDWTCTGVRCAQSTQTERTQTTNYDVWCCDHFHFVREGTHRAFRTVRANYTRTRLCPTETLETRLGLGECCPLCQTQRSGTGRSMTIGYGSKGTTNYCQFSYQWCFGLDESNARCCKQLAWRTVDRNARGTGCQGERTQTRNVDNAPMLQTFIKMLPKKCGVKYKKMQLYEHITNTVISFPVYWCKSILNTWNCATENQLPANNCWMDLLWHHNFLDLSGYF